MVFQANPHPQDRPTIVLRCGSGFRTYRWSTFVGQCQSTLAVQMTVLMDARLNAWIYSRFKSLRSITPIVGMKHPLEMNPPTLPNFLTTDTPWYSAAPTPSASPNGDTIGRTRPPYLVSNKRMRPSARFGSRFRMTSNRLSFSTTV